MTGMTKGWGWSYLLHQKILSFQHHSDHSTINIRCLPIWQLISVIEWVSNDEIWLKWGWNDKEKNLGHLPCFKNFIISPSFESLIIILGWENGHSSIILFTLRSFSVRMTIEWQKRHFKMTQNDRDGLGMRKIKIISMKNVPHSNIIQVIPTSFWVEWHLYDAEFEQSNFCHIGRQGYQVNASLA